VQAFLNGELRYLAIPKVIKQVVTHCAWAEPTNLTQVHSLDRDARELAKSVCRAIEYRIIDHQTSHHQTSEQK